MKFLTIEDLNIRKFQSLIDSISGDDNTVLSNLVDMSIEEVSTYLRNRYDVEYLFRQTGDLRNNLLKRLVIDFTICFLYERVNSNEVPDSLKERCDKNLTMLRDIAKGTLSPDFPLKTSNPTENGFIIIDSENRFTDI